MIWNSWKLLLYLKIQRTVQSLSEKLGFNNLICNFAISKDRAPLWMWGNKSQMNPRWYIATNIVPPYKISCLDLPPSMQIFTAWWILPGSAHRCDEINVFSTNSGFLSTLLVLYLILTLLRSYNVACYWGCRRFIIWNWWDTLRLHCLTNWMIFF